MQKVTVQVISNEQCRKIPAYQNGRRLPSGIIDTQLCAGTQDGGKDACQVKQEYLISNIFDIPNK